MFPGTVTVSAVLLINRPLAIFVTTGSQGVWLPRSLIRASRPPISKYAIDRPVELTIPAWLATQKGLIPGAHRVIDEPHDLDEALQKAKEAAQGEEARAAMLAPLNRPSSPLDLDLDTALIRSSQDLNRPFPNEGLTIKTMRALCDLVDELRRKLAEQWPDVPAQIEMAKAFEHGMRESMAPSALAKLPLRPRPDRSVWVLDEELLCDEES